MEQTSNINQWVNIEIIFQQMGSRSHYLEIWRCYITALARLSPAPPHTPPLSQRETRAEYAPSRLPALGSEYRFPAALLAVQECLRWLGSDHVYYVAPDRDRWLRNSRM